MLYLFNFRISSYYDYSRFGDKDFSLMTLQDVQEHKQEGQEALRERIEPWLQSVFRDQTIPFIETIETKGPNYTSWQMAMPVGKEYSQEAVDVAEPEFIECLQTLYKQNAAYKIASEKALVHYIEKRSEYIKNLISEHHADKENIFECYYSHMGCGGEAISCMLDNGKTYSIVNLDFYPFLKKSSIAEKHGYLATLLIRLTKEANTIEELQISAEKLAQEDFDLEAATLLHEIGHINNGDERYKRTIKRILPTLTALLGATTLALSQKDMHPLVATGFCASNILAAALTTPFVALRSRGHSCFAVWLNNFIGEYRADSYELAYANSVQLNNSKRFFEKAIEEFGNGCDPLDTHLSNRNRIKRIEKQIKKLEDSQK